MKDLQKLTKHFKEHGEIDCSLIHVYDYLHKEGLLPNHTASYREEKKSDLVELLISEKEGANVFDDLNSFYDKTRFKSLTHLIKEIILKEYLQTLVS